MSRLAGTVSRSFGSMGTVPRSWVRALWTPLALLGSCSPPPAERPALELLRFEQRDLQDVRLNEELAFFFSEPLDPASVTSASVRIEDESGEPTRGTLRTQGDRLYFQPDLPRERGLEDGGFLPGRRYRVVLGGWPRVDGLRTAEGVLLSSTAALAFQTASQGGEERLFLDPSLELGILIPMDERREIGPLDPIRLRCEKGLDPRTVEDEDFRLWRLQSGPGTPEREFVDLRVVLAQNRTDEAILTLEPWVRGADVTEGRRALEPSDGVGPYYLELWGDGLRDLAGRPVVAGWARDFLDYTVRPKFRVLPKSLEFDDTVDRWAGLPAKVAGTARWVQGGGAIHVPYPAAAGTGVDGDVVLGSASEHIDVHPTTLSIADGETLDLTSRERLVVLRSQGRLTVDGRLIRRRRAADSDAAPPAPTDAERALRNLLEGELPTTTLTDWLERARESREPWTVLVAGAELIVNGEIDVQGPLILVAGGWVRVYGQLRHDGLWQTAGSDRRVERPLALRIDPPRLNPLQKPLVFGVRSRWIRPQGGVEAWRPAVIDEHRGMGSVSVRFTGQRDTAGDEGSFVGVDDLSQLDFTRIQFQVNLTLPAATGTPEPWDPPRVDSIDLYWTTPPPSR